MRRNFLVTDPVSHVSNLLNTVYSCNRMHIEDTLTLRELQNSDDNLFKLMCKYLIRSKKEKVILKGGGRVQYDRRHGGYNNNNNN